MYFSRTYLGKLLLNINDNIDTTFILTDSLCCNAELLNTLMIRWPKDTTPQEAEQCDVAITVHMICMMLQMDWELRDMKAWSRIRQQEQTAREEDQGNLS